MLTMIKPTQKNSNWMPADTQMHPYWEEIPGYTSLTRTNRTPAFWGYPPPPHDYPYHWVILDPKVKRRQSQSYKFKKFAKISNLWIFKQALYATHLLKLLDKMCKYEMDPMSIVEDTERTRFCPQTDRRTRWYQYTPLSTSLKPGV